MAVCEDCKLENRVMAIEKRQGDMETLVTSVATLAVELGHMKDDMAEIKSDVKVITGQPVKRWEALKAAILTAAVSASVSGLIGFMLGAFLRGGA